MTDRNSEKTLATYEARSYVGIKSLSGLSVLNARFQCGVSMIVRHRMIRCEVIFGCVMFLWSVYTRILCPYSIFLYSLRSSIHDG